MHIDAHRGEGRAEDAGIFGANDGEDFNIIRDVQARIDGCVHDGSGDGVAIADEQPAFDGLEVFLKVHVGARVGIIRIDDAYLFAEVF